MTTDTSAIRPAGARRPAVPFGRSKSATTSATRRRSASGRRMMSPEDSATTASSRLPVKPCRRFRGVLTACGTVLSERSIGVRRARRCQVSYSKLSSSVTFEITLAAPVRFAVTC